MEHTSTITAQTNKRKIELDILKGICIFLMIFDHVDWGWDFHTYIQSFHMPVFFLISGYLKSNHTIFTTIKHRLQTLILPYFCFSFFYLYCLFLTDGNTENMINAIKAVLLYPNDIDNMPFSPPLWFLPCLFLVEIIYTIFLNIPRKHIVLIAIPALCFPIVLYSYTSNSLLPFVLEPVASGLIFYTIGNYMKYIKHKLNFNNLILSFLLFAIHIHTVFINSAVDMRSGRYHNFFLFLFNALIGTGFVYHLSMCIAKNNNKITKLIKACFSYLSINSMSFLCINYPLAHFFNSLLSIDNTVSVNVPMRSISLILTLISCFLLNCVIKRSKLCFVLGR